MKKILFLLAILFIIIFFTKFYDINDTLKFRKIFKNFKYNIENIVKNNEKNNKWNNNWETINKSYEEKIDWNNIINNNLIKYENSNITYTNGNWEIFTWIWTIRLNYNGNIITILDRNLWATINDINNENSFW